MENNWLEDLRQKYVRIIEDRQVTHAENILARSDWLGYVVYCRMAADRLPNRAARVIDWGGLYGHVTLIFRELGYADVSNYLLHENPFYPYFQQAFQISTCWGRRPNRLELADRSVDAFISSGVLEHVGEDGEGDEGLILEEVCRVLKPEGLLFIWNLPAQWGSSELLAMLAGKWHHTRRFREQEIRVLLRRAGFRILDIFKHKILPGTAREWLGRRLDPVRLMGWDDRLSRRFPLSLLARDYVIVARKGAGYGSGSY